MDFSPLTRVVLCVAALSVLAPQAQAGGSNCMTQAASINPITTVTFGSMMVGRQVQFTNVSSSASLRCRTVGTGANNNATCVNATVLGSMTPITVNTVTLSPRGTATGTMPLCVFECEYNAGCTLHIDGPNNGLPIELMGFDVGS